MKKLYFFQVNYSYGASAHLPYTAAELSAYAFADKNVAENFVLADMFYIRENIDVAVSRVTHPGVVAFSTYIWNCEFNLAAAKKIREKYPDCVIIFGGHHVFPGGKQLEAYPFIDYLIHGEGEEAFRRLLLSAAGLDNPENIPGVSFRTAHGIVTNRSVISNEEYIDYPSPYLGGYLDKIVAEHPETEFMALIETTRGCPNSCSYCDWSNMKSRIRKFPMERVLAEIKWASEHKIPGLGAADSNFGIYERDEEITDYIVKMHCENGYPQGFQTSYAKNSNERIFRIGCKLDRQRINKGVTLSFQSMSDEVLKNIGRKNIPVSSFAELMKMYNDAGVATYTELILGLPGETYDSFCDGIDRLLNLGQHNSIYIHNCEWLPCAVMGSPEYVEKYKIGTSKIPLNQPHIEEDPEDNIREWSMLVTSTCSMTPEDWIKMNLFSFTVQCYHHMGLLEFFAIYLHSEMNIGYRDFYSQFLEFSFRSENKLLYGIYEYVKKRLSDIPAGREGASFVCIDSRFGKVHWTFEEYMFLCTVYELDEFMAEAKAFLSRFNIEPELFAQLLDFQREMIKQPFVSRKTLHYKFDFCQYFRAALKGQNTKLSVKPNTLEIKTKGPSWPSAVLAAQPNTVEITTRCLDSWEEYSKVVAWYGRKDSRCVYINEANIIQNENCEE